MASNSQLTEEDTNFTTFFLLTFKVSPDITRRFFDTKFPPPHLTQIINSNIKVIVNLNKRGRINAAQLDILRCIPGTVWPPNLPTTHYGTNATSSKDFDLTLMICLLRNLSLPQPQNGWEQLPHPNDMSPSANLATLKWYRNKMAHTTVCSMNASEFQDKWRRVEKALTCLNGGQKPQEVTDLLNLDLDGEVARSTAEAELTDLRKEFLQSEQEKQQLQNQCACLVKNWQKEDKVFFETKGTPCIYDMVKKDCNCILVSSRSGSGKTAAIRHIALKLQSEGFQILPIEKPGDLIKYQTNQKQVFLIDDVLGKYDLIPKKLQDWETMNEKLISCLDAKSGSKKILCTLRNQIAANKRFENASTILNKRVIDLEKEAIALSKEEKQNILFKHLQVNDLENEVSEDEVEMMCETNYAFALLCKLISNDEDRFRNRIAFFERPWSLLQEELAQMCWKNKKLYCILVLCMLFNGTLSKTVFDIDSTEHDKKIRKIMETCELETNMSKTELFNSALPAIGTYFSDNTNTLTFIHDFLEETVGFHFSQTNPKVMFTECDILFLRNRVNVHCNEIVEENIMTIQEKDLYEDNFRPIYDRFLEELRIGKFSNVLMSLLITNKAFVRIFIKQIPTISIRDLLGRVSTERVKSHTGLTELTTELLQYNKNFQKQIDAISRVMRAIWCRCTLMYCIVAFGCYELFQLAWGELTKVEKKRLLGKDFFPLMRVKSFFPLAVLGGNIGIVSKLIADGADVNCFSEFMETPLYIASKSGKYQIVCLLIEKGARVNLGSWFHLKVPIVVAANKLNLISILLEHDLQQTELHQAVRLENFKKLRTSCNSYNIDSKTKSGWTPLHFAVALRNVEAVKVLFDEISKNNVKSVVLGAQRSLLIKKPIPNINIPDINGLTAIHLAVINDDIETITVLLHHNADVNVRDDYDRTPLHYITSVKATKALLAHKNNNLENNLDAENQREYCNKPRSSALFTICRNITRQTALRLIFRDIVNKPDKDGNTPLHFVVKHKHDDIVEVLLQNGADPFLPNDANDVPFKYIKHKRKNVKWINDGTKQSIKNTFNILFFVLLLIFLVSYVLEFYILLKRQRISCCFDNFEPLNKSASIDHVDLLHTKIGLNISVSFLSTMVTGIFPLFIVFLGYSTFWMIVEHISIFTRFVFVVYSCVIVFGMQDGSTFMYYAMYVAIVCTLFLQISSCIYSLLSMSTYMSMDCSTICLYITAVIMLISALIIFVISSILSSFSNVSTDYLSINVPDCDTFNSTFIHCAGPGYNNTFENGNDFLVKCKTIPNTTEHSGTLNVYSETLYYNRTFLFYLFSLFQGACVYCFINTVNSEIIACIYYCDFPIFVQNAISNNATAACVVTESKYLKTKCEFLLLRSESSRNIRINKNLAIISEFTVYWYTEVGFRKYDLSFFYEKST